MTSASTPNGRKNSIDESSAAISAAPHQVRKNQKRDRKKAFTTHDSRFTIHDSRLTTHDSNEWLPTDAVVFRRDLRGIEGNTYEIDDDLIGPAPCDRLGKFRRRVPLPGHIGR